ncbi:hypothetical protein V2O64_00540 [Verrucomicrobiaceae bacterium 227]
MNQLLARSIFLSALGAPLMAIYLLINHREGVAHRVVEMPDGVPFWPLMTIPYLLMLIVPWLGACTLREPQNFYQYLVSVLLSFLVIGSIWYFFPTEMTRPLTPEGPLYQIHRDLIAVDKPVCIAPCGHVMGPLTIIYLLACEKRTRLYWMLPLLGLGFLSIATTWQHRPLDILTGSIITLISVMLTRRIFRKWLEG